MTDATVEVFVAAGSNVDPFNHLRRALAELKRRYPAMRVSTAYRNKAVGFEGDDFVNLAVGFVTNDSLQQVVAHLHDAEAACGRPRNAPKWAPRAMDLDLLLYDAVVCNEPGLKLPRPDLLKRSYMLRPLAELAPDLRHPTAHKTMRELWNEFDRDAHAMVAVELV